MFPLIFCSELLVLQWRADGPDVLDPEGIADGSRGSSEAITTDSFENRYVILKGS